MTTDRAGLEIWSSVLKCGEERRVMHRDPIGNFEAVFAERRWDAPLYRPTLNERLYEEDAVWRAAISWPEGKRFAACLSHDVDHIEVHGRRDLVRGAMNRIRHAKNAADVVRGASAFVGLRRGNANIDVFEPWLKLEASFGFRSSFFVFPPVVEPRDIRDSVYRWDDPAPFRGSTASAREVFTTIADEGWDIGLHGSIASALSYDVLARQKTDVQEGIDREVSTIRQHNLHFDISITPHIQARAGFSADSTLGFNRDIGFRSGIAYPHRMWGYERNDWLDLLQVPLMLQDGALLREDNLALTEDAAFLLAARLIDRVAETKGVVTLLWHPHTVAMPAWWNLYARLLKYIKDRDGWGASVRQVDDWWRRRGMVQKLERSLANLNHRGTTA